jgi:hypothetical protein
MIHSRGWVEAYVHRRLSPEDSEAFERHYFECDECFTEVQDMQRFAAGMGDAAKRGLLDPRPARAGWLSPAFALAAAAAVVLAVGLCYVTLIRLPDRESRLREALVQARQGQTLAAELDRRVAIEAAPQPNVPVVILTANRSGSDAPEQLAASEETRSAVLWIDIAPQPAGTTFLLTISTPDDRMSTAIHGLQRNRNGALAASLPVTGLSQGLYMIRVYAEQAPGKMIAEYRMNVVRQ